MKKQRIKLDLIPDTSIAPLINVKQYDYGERVLQFQIYDNGQKYTIPFGTQVYFQATKPDSHGLSEHCEFSDNVVTCTCTEQMTAVAGCFKAELRFHYLDGSVGSADFNMNVAKAPVGEGTTISSSEISGVRTLVDDVAAVKVAQTDARDSKEATVATTTALTNGYVNLAKTASEMTNTKAVYLYVGEQPDYKRNTWYYYSDNKWIPASDDVVKQTAQDNMVAGMAKKLQNKRKLLTSLEGTTEENFDGTEDADNIGVKGTLPVTHGGTGVTQLNAGEAVLGGGTSGFSTRSILDNSTVTSVAKSNSLVTADTVANWNGAYSGTTSNLRYGEKGYIPGTTSSTSLGNSTLPIYIDNNGVLQQCDKLPQTGSINQPIYIDSNGKFQTGNAITKTGSVNQPIYIDANGKFQAGNAITQTGSVTQPIYIDSNGKFQTCEISFHEASQTDIEQMLNSMSPSTTENSSQNATEGGA